MTPELCQSTGACCSGSWMTPPWRARAAKLPPLPHLNVSWTGFDELHAGAARFLKRHVAGGSTVNILGSVTPVIDSSSLRLRAGGRAKVRFR